MDNMQGQDFIVSTLLSELKDENERKSKLIRGLIKVIVGCVVAILATVGGFLLYLNQYDFTSSEYNYANGAYALIDSQGNVIAEDFTEDELTKIMEVVETHGISTQSPNPTQD